MTNSLRPSKECCPHCGQAIMQNKQMFSKALGDILMTAACEYRAELPFHLQLHLTLTKSQYTNFQKLRYWGLVKKSFNPDGTRRSGYWELTTLVRYVVQGKAIPKWKLTFNNKVVESSEETITLEQAVGSYEVPAQWAERARPMPNLMQPDLFSEVR